MRHERAQPAALKIGPDGLSAWGRAGKLLAQGRIAGCSQWSGRLLILALAAGSRGAPRTLLLAADALPAPVFRELSVLGRRARRRLTVTTVTAVTGVTCPNDGDATMVPRHAPYS